MRLFSGSEADADAASSVGQLVRHQIVCAVLEEGTWVEQEYFPIIFCIFLSNSVAYFLPSGTGPPGIAAMPVWPVRH